LKETKFKMAAALQQQQLKNKQPKWQWELVPLFYGHKKEHTMNI
jgi:hypothetical protein